MKILLLYPEVGIGVRWSELLSVGVLGALIRQSRHRFSLIHYKHPAQIEGIQKFAETFDPDLVVADVAWDQWTAITPLLERVRSACPRPMVVVSGVYPTLDPETVIQNPSVDSVLIGEVETALMDLVQRIATRLNCTDAQNFWFKLRDNRILKNSLRPLIPDLDMLPFTDRTLYDHAGLVQASGGAFPMVASRGCQHNCQFCYCPRLKQVSSGKGTFVRARGVFSLAAEIHQAQKTETIERVDFVDEYFPLNIDWLSQFCAIWKSQVNLPFRFTAVGELLTPEILEMLHDANCEGFRLGIETGDEKFRQRIADRNLSNKRLQGICDEARRLNMNVELHTMVGLPLENPDLSKATVQFAEQLRPAAVHVNIYRPIPGTELYQLCKDNGYLTPALEEPPACNPRQTLLKLPAITDEQVLQAYDELKQLDGKLKIASAILPENGIDLVELIDQARVESPVEPALSVGKWSFEQDERFCLFQAVGSRATFNFDLRESSALIFGVCAGPWPYAIRYPRSAQIEIRLRQGEYEDLLFANTVVMSPRKSRKGWFDVRVPLQEWPAGPAELEIVILPVGSVPLAPVWVAFSRPRFVDEGFQASTTPTRSKKMLMLEQEFQKMRGEVTQSREEIKTLREDLDLRKQRIGELHVQVLELEKELEKLRSEKAKWDSLQDQLENAITGKTKRHK